MQFIWEICVLSLLQAQRPLCVRRRLGRGKKKARGRRWEGEREGVRPRSNVFPAFSLFPLSTARVLFFSFKYSYIYWNTTRVPLRRREICVCVASLGVLRKCALSFVLNRCPRQKPLNRGNETTKRDEF